MVPPDQAGAGYIFMFLRRNCFRFFEMRTTDTFQLHICLEIERILGKMSDEWKDAAVACNRDSFGIYEKKLQTGCAESTSLLTLL